MSNMIYSGGKNDKEKLVAFANSNIGYKINIHFECNLYDGWGDDSDFTYDTNNDKHYQELMDTIATHYIHGIKIA